MKTTSKTKKTKKTNAAPHISEAHEIRFLDKTGCTRYGVGITEVSLFGKPFIKVRDKFTQKTRYVSQKKILHIVW